MKEKEEFGKFISMKRKEAGLTQRELAEKLYVTESAVSKWERGRSYPDIAAVTPLCNILNITEHELITASDDKHQREIEKQATVYRNTKTGYLRILCFLYIAALAICLICNLAVNHTVSWFYMVLGGVAIAFSLTVVPVVSDNRKGLWTLGTFSASLCFLLIAARVLFKGQWLLVTLSAILLGMAAAFFPFLIRQMHLPRSLSRHKALLCLSLDSVLTFLLVTISTLQFGDPNRLASAYSILLFCLLIPWLFLLAIRYCPVNKAFKAALCFFITGAFIYFTNNVIYSILEQEPLQMLKINFHNWSNDVFINGNITFILTLACIIIGILFAVGGIISRAKKK